MNMIEDALRVNFTSYFDGNSFKLAASDYEPRICAVDLEHGILKSNKLMNTYKANIVKLTNEIKKTTKEKNLHMSFVPKSSNSATFLSAAKLLDNDMDNCDEDATLDNSENRQNVVFRKASDLLKNGSLAATEGVEVSNETKSDEFGELSCPSTSELGTNLDCKSDTSTVLIKKEVPKIKYFFEETEKDEVEVCSSNIPSSSNMLPDMDSENSTLKYASVQDNQHKGFTGMKRQLNEVVIYHYYSFSPTAKDYL